ncbi:hypothetical protein EDC01DRAFT_658290 [Geopyxis carbonaria]|nr:hypothetical protein EDC01DRAFT_658290 [Geopyxis carbonaria]
MANINSYRPGTDQQVLKNNNSEIDFSLVQQFRAGLDNQEINHPTALHQVPNFAPVANQYLYENYPYYPVDPNLQAPYMAQDHYGSSKPLAGQSSEREPQQPDGTATLRCTGFPDCNRSFSGASAKTKLKRHADSHNKPYRCRYKSCSRHTKGFSRKDNLATHMRLHREKKSCSRGNSVHADGLRGNRTDERTLTLTLLRRNIRNLENSLEDLRELEKKMVYNEEQEEEEEEEDEEDEEDV